MPDREQHNDVHVAADSAAAAEDWATLWALRSRLRGSDLWVGYYGASCAVAGWHVDRDAGRALLDEVVTAGFSQPELLQDELAASFAGEPGWEERLERMRANVPAPPVELLDWPDHAPTLEPVLDRLPPDREAVLRDRLPSLDGSAWATALQLLEWATTRWEHANGHVQDRDAVEILDRAAAGERFACVEYTVVLSQALNAARIPARSVSLLMRDHHTGAGRGHVATEAWVDDLGRWVLLDGQNGAWWGEDTPLGVLDLMERYAEGDRPPMNTLRPMSSSEQATWFWYFAATRTTGLTWSDGPFVPTFQTDGVLQTDRLVHGREHVEPDLARIGTGIREVQGRPAVTFAPTHPYASGVEVRCVGQSADPVRLAVGAAFPLHGRPGDHSFDVATVTPFGTLAPSALRYVTR